MLLSGLIRLLLAGSAGGVQWTAVHYAPVRGLCSESSEFKQCSCKLAKNTTY